MTGGSGLLRDYRSAFLRYLPRHEEAALRRGYEIGRAALSDGLSLLELAQVHHEVLIEVLRETPADELAELAASASSFFLEVLASYDMAQRGFLDGRAGTVQGRAGG